MWLPCLIMRGIMIHKLCNDAINLNSIASLSS